MALVLTLMEMAKVNYLRLGDNIQYMLAVLPERFASDPSADIDDLLPWANGIQVLFGMPVTGCY